MLTIALIVLGPEQLPVVARTIFKIIREIRVAANETLREIRASLEESPAQSPDRTRSTSETKAKQDKTEAEERAVYGSFYSRPSNSATPGKVETEKASTDSLADHAAEKGFEENYLSAETASSYSYEFFEDPRHPAEGVSDTAVARQETSNTEALTRPEDDMKKEESASSQAQGHVQSNEQGALNLNEGQKISPGKDLSDES